MGTALAMTRPKVWSTVWAAAGAVALAGLTAVLTYFATARLNVETAVQQQQSAAIQQFEQSGSQMDASLSLFVDALLDKQGVKDARKDVRSAITVHGSQAASLTPLAGEGNVSQYVKALGDLRTFADAAQDPRSARKMAQQHVNLMAYRQKLVALAKSNVYK